MDGRAFLELAREVVTGATEAHWRGAAIHAYYRLMLECREALRRWGVKIPPHQTIHQFVRLRFVYAKDPDLHTIGKELDRLSQPRNHASYNLNPGSVFFSDGKAQQAITRATDALSLLDALEADPARRAAAIASLPP